MMKWRRTWEGRVQEDWLDELDHVNFLVYQRIADWGGEAFWEEISGGKTFAERDAACVMLETHVRYLSELRRDDSVVVETALLNFDTKRYQLLHRICSGDETACTVETVNLSFDLRSRRASVFSGQVAAALQSIGPAPSTGELPLRRERNPA